MEYDLEHCYKITYMRNEKYIIPIANSDEGYRFWAYSGDHWPEDDENIEGTWVEIAIIVGMINSVDDSRLLGEMGIVKDEIGEEKRPNFLTKLKF
jgi:hypothetical protein